MKKAYLMYIRTAVLTMSCSKQYIVQGLTSVQQLEGEMLRLKVYRDNQMLTIDSSMVVHGKFNFTGPVDSILLASLYVEEACVMPLVLEEGIVTMKIDALTQSATGTPLNDSLSFFIQRKMQLDAQMAELPRKESRMIMNGIEHNEILRQLNEENRLLMEQHEKLVSHFISSNYENVLGPGIFMIMTSSMNYPVITPQIDAILRTAPASFLSHPYVKEYIQIAEENMKKIKE